MALDPLLVLYRYPLPILNEFERQYMTGAIYPIGRQVQPHTVEDAVLLIGQDLADLGAIYPHLKSQG